MVEASKAILQPDMDDWRKLKTAYQQLNGVRNPADLEEGGSHYYNFFGYFAARGRRWARRAAASQKLWL